MQEYQYKPQPQQRIVVNEAELREYIDRKQNEKKEGTKNDPKNELRSLTYYIKQLVGKTFELMTFEI